MKKLIIISAALSIILTGFVLATPKGNDNDGHGGPPWMEKGNPPPPPKGRQQGRPPWMKEGREHKGCPGMERKHPQHPSIRGEKNHREMRKKIEKKIRKLRGNNPEEFERLMKLRKENPGAFRKEIHKRYKKQFEKENPEAFKRMQEMKKIKKQVYGLNQKFKKCKDADKKKELKQQMRDLIGRAFDVTQEFREKEISNLEKKTKQLRQKVRKRGKNKKEMVDLRLKGLIDGEETVKW
ncbi:MAG: hypothetical protein DRI44_00010 [Chlamydiae bacterium]|nr:MAG: hypothetical protein DRI44_00010 [Chlamydiota bacterium]